MLWERESQRRGPGRKTVIHETNRKLSELLFGCSSALVKYNKENLMGPRLGMR